MLMCSETVTLVRHIKEPDDDRYECTVIAGASWYGKAAAVQTAKGLQPQNVYKSRIPAELLPVGVAPREGDYLIHGVVTEVRRAPADFQNREYMRVAAVSDNRRGKFFHWAVSGA